MTIPLFCIINSSNAHKLSSHNSCQKHNKMMIILNYKFVRFFIYILLRLTHLILCSQNCSFHFPSFFSVARVWQSVFFFFAASYYVLFIFFFSYSVKKKTTETCEQWICTCKIYGHMCMLVKMLARKMHEKNLLWLPLAKLNLVLAVIRSVHKVH